jgi:hypothetical protein
MPRPYYRPANRPRARVAGGDEAGRRACLLRPPPLLFNPITKGMARSLAEALIQPHVRIKREIHPTII